MKTKRNMIIFISMVLLSGWVGILVDRFIPGQSKGDTLGMGLWLVLSLLTTIVLRGFAGDG